MERSQSVPVSLEESMDGEIVPFLRMMMFFESA